MDASRFDIQRLDHLGLVLCFCKEIGLEGLSPYTATAYKIARLIYSMMKHGQDYVDAGQDYYDQQYKERIVKNMQKRALMLGFELTPISAFTSKVP